MCYSQEELAIKLNVVRQTISKWEKGLSVPDSEMLVAMSDVLEIPVSTLLGESIVEEREDEIKVISEKLEIINLQLSKISIKKRRLIHWMLISVCAIIVAIFKEVDVDLVVPELSDVIVIDPSTDIYEEMSLCCGIFFILNGGHNSRH
ncbi:MAG: helix-turn-helix transcriptional regulator [Lachnospiraceae bacterium]